MPSVTLLPMSVLDQIFLYAFNVVHPLPPTSLAATYTTDPTNRNQRLIRLTWVAPVGMPDTISYNIYRNGALIGNVLATEPLVYLDDGTGGDVDFFTYFLTSVDPSQNESAVSASITNFTQTLERYIFMLRESLKDNPPDPTVMRWTDCDLLLALRQALSRVNAIPMTTYFDFDTAPPDFFHYILAAARISALRSQASLEASKEFSMGAGGINMNITRTGLYGALLGSEEQAWQKEIENVKRYMTMRVVHGEGILTSPMPFKIRTFAPRQYRIR